ncbi:MAG: ATP-binding cassette domain-containing protein [Spirochaetes bacterium]|nr:ATP-binding cassette domain-containing protein [Spirochaetota bacterium]
MDARCVVKTVGVTKVFGDFVAVNSVDFEVNDREAVGIIGPNGAGKTTFLNLLSGLYMPEEGSVFFKGRDVTRVPPQKRIEMGMMRTFQLVHVFDNISVYDNLALSYYRKLEGRAFPPGSVFTRLFRKDIEKIVGDVLELFELDKRSTQIVSNLPLGSKKRMELAMAHIADPEVILLDEPFAGLGDIEIDEILGILTHYIHKKTIIIVEHKITKLTQIVDKLAVMCDGAIIACGGCEETLNDPEVRKSYWKVSEDEQVCL